MGGSWTRPFFLMARKFEDLAGRRFGRWLVVEYAGVNRLGRHTWVCRCDCGTTKGSVDSSNLLSGGSKSCGCMQREASAGAQRKHGHLDGGACSLTYNSWRAMVGRCTNQTDKSYSFYGGRGISVCDQWISFDAFLQDMGERPGRKFELDRIDNSKGYEPGNVRWATHRQNGRNTRANRAISTPLGEMLLCEAVEASGLSLSVITGRLRRGWPTEKLFDKPRRLDKQNVRMLNTPDGQMRMADACRRYGIPVSTVSTRLAAGWPEDRLFEKPRGKKP